MLIRLETSSGVPVTRQVADQIRGHIAAGTLAAGDRLPSVRQLAAAVPVNVNTVLRVYERLTVEGPAGAAAGGRDVRRRRACRRARLKAERAVLADEVERLANRALDLGVAAEPSCGRLLDESLARLGKQRRVRPCLMTNR